MALNLSPQEASYRMQASFPQTTFVDNRTMSHGSPESTSSDNSTISLAHSMEQSRRNRCCSLLFIFTFYLLLSICLALGLSYTDDKGAFLRARSLSLHDTEIPNFSDGRILPSVPPVWERLKGGEHCLRYATREYTARLSSNAIGQEAMKACKETPTEIHGRLLLTDFCQDLGLGRGVWGFWIVNSDEPACETTWGNFVDLGCAENGLDMGSSSRRVEARLDNLQTGADWRIMCATTPADIHGRHFFPAECFNLGRLGIFGAWDMQDTSCESSD
ncbi:hypothetical protein BYT27DRAFT_7192541 [Phlegmacium glaucopus]|nr:hypothetical protein BYT27DRAFT_7192541 [Phlegmacium glaucopus]